MTANKAIHPVRAGRREVAGWRRFILPSGLVLSLVLLSACASGSQVAAPAADGSTPAGQASTGTPQAGAGQASASTAKLEPFTETIPGTLVKFNMIPLPAGQVTVETAQGPKTVDVKPVWISETEVQWDAFDIYAYGLDLKEAGQEPGSDGIIRPSKPYGAPDRGFGHQGYAALSMSYGVGTEYCRWLSQKTGHTYRLATVAEYEYACRAGGENKPANLDEYAWFADNSENKTHPVASKKPNAWGIYDMMGNALEWCTGVDGEQFACGGSYLTPAADLSCSAREKQTPAWQETDPQIPKSVFWLTDATFIGFRIVREQ